MSAIHPETLSKKSPEMSAEPNMCPRESVQPPKVRLFVPPQGMDAGEYPKSLFYQYYPNKREEYTYELLPLPFMDRLKFQQMRALSMDNENLHNKWNNFLYGLPDSELEIVPNIDERYWRWEKYLKYVPSETRTDFRKNMTVGPKLDHMGHLPIVGEDLPTFREFRETILKPATNVKYILKRGDGQKRSIVKPNLSRRTQL